MEYNDSIKNRLKRIEGQLRGIIRMMEDDKGCKDVITQLSAVRSGVDKTIGLIVSSNLVDCVIEANSKGDTYDKSVEDAVNLLVKSR